MIKVLKLDYTLVCSQLITIICTICFSFVVSIVLNMPIVVIGALFMMNMIFSTIPFEMDKDYKFCFYDMLPISRKIKIVARYTFLSINTLFTSAFSLLILYISAQRMRVVIKGIFYVVFVFMVSISFVLACLQYLIYYKVEATISKQNSLWLRFIPAFGMMMLVNLFGEKLIDSSLLRVVNNCFLQALFGEKCKIFLENVASPNWRKLQGLGWQLFCQLHSHCRPYLVVIA